MKTNLYWDLFLILLLLLYSFKWQYIAGAGAGAEIMDKGGAERSRSRNNVQRWSRKEPEAKVNNFGSAKLFYFRYFSILLKHSGTPIIVTEEEKKLQRKATFFEGGSSSQESSASVPQHRIMNKRFHNIAWRCDKFSIARFAANISRTRVFKCWPVRYQIFRGSDRVGAHHWDDDGAGGCEPRHHDLPPDTQAHLASCSAGLTLLVPHQAGTLQTTPSWYFYFYGQNFRYCKTLSSRSDKDPENFTNLPPPMGQKYNT